MNFVNLYFLTLVKIILSKDIHFTIPEELPSGSYVGEFKVYISFLQANTLRMSNINPSINDLFRLESLTLKVEKRIDREDICSQHSKNNDCILKLIIIYGEMQKPLFLTVYITVTDINDNAPKFSESQIEHIINENANPGLSDLVLIEAEDFDRLDNGSISYQLLQDKESSQIQKFRLQLTPENIPKLIQLTALDYEIQKVYYMHLIAFDGGQPSKTGTLKIKIKVKDENDNVPIFEKTKYEETINEDMPINTKILEVTANDADLDENGRITYQPVTSSTLQQKLSETYFGIRNYQGKGIIYVKSSIDVDVIPRIHSFDFAVLACDSGIRQLCSRTTVLIRVNDVNDYRPSISITYISTNGRNTAACIIPENSVNNYIAIITVTDKDEEPGGTVECHLSNSKFELYQGMNDRDSRELYRNKDRSSDTNVYHIRNIKEFDREEIDVVRFKINCRDNPSQQKSPLTITQLVNEADITVLIKDVNDNSPEFLRNPYEFKALENRPFNTDKILSLGTIEAVDKDVNTKFSYKLISNPFQAFELEENGELFLRRSFDREDISINPVRIQVLVSDGKYNTSTNVNIHILDDNDLAPVFQRDTYRFSCVENTFSTYIGSVEATDGDTAEFGLIEYRIFPPTPLFSINSKTGMIRVTTRLDREEKDSYSFTVIAIDNAKEKGNRNTGTTTVVITVQDLNDNYPRILFPHPQKVTLLDPQWAVGHKVFTMKATDSDLLENGTVIYKIAKDGLGLFNIDPKSGDLFLSRKLTMSESQVITSHLLLIASDNGYPIPKSTTVSVTVKIAIDNSIDSMDFGSDYSQANIPQTERSNRKTLIIIVIVALALIVTVIMIILIVIYQSRIPAQNHTIRNSKRKQAEFQEIQNKDQIQCSMESAQHFMTTDETFIVPVSNKYFQNSFMRQEDKKDLNIEKLHDSSHLNEYQQLMSNPTLMRIWQNNLNPYNDLRSFEKSYQIPSSSSGMTPIITSSEVTDEKPQIKEQSSSNNYLQSSFV